MARHAAEIDYKCFTIHQCFHRLLSQKCHDSPPVKFSPALYNGHSSFSPPCQLLGVLNFCINCYLPIRTQQFNRSASNRVLQIYDIQWSKKIFYFLEWLSISANGQASLVVAASILKGPYPWAWLPSIWLELYHQLKAALHFSGKLISPTIKFMAPSHNR